MSSESGQSYYLEPWFEYVFMAACCLLGFFLFNQLMPPISVNAETLQNVAMARLFAEGRWLQAFSHFNSPPVYPILLSLVIRLRHATDLSGLLLNFKNLNLYLYLISGILVFYFIRRHIHKPYLFIITLLYMLAPPILNMAWTLDPQMTYMVLSMGALLAIDISLSWDSAMGGDLSRGEIILCGLMLGLCILTRQVGYTLLIAFFFVMIKRFTFKKSLSVIGYIILTISPFVGRDLFYAIRSPEPYVAPSVALLQQANNHGVMHTMESSADQAVFTIANHAVGDLNLNTLDDVAQAPRKRGPDHISLAHRSWGRWLLAGLALVGALYGVSLYTGIATIYVCVYTMTALVFLPQWNLPLSLVLPLLLFFLFYGVSQTSRWFQPMNISPSRFVAPALAVWILLCSFTTLLAQARNTEHPFRLGLRTPRIMYMSTAQESDDRLFEAQTKTAHHKAMDWLDAHTPQSARIGSARGNVPNPAIAGQAAQEQWQREVSQYDYLVEEGSSRIAPLKRSSTDGRSLKLVYEDAPGRIRIWQVHPTASL